MITFFFHVMLLLLFLFFGSSTSLSVHGLHWSHILECLQWDGGRRRPGPSHWCSCRHRWIWSTQCSSRSQRWCTASREQLVVHHKALKDTWHVRKDRVHTVSNRCCYRPWSIMLGIYWWYFAVNIVFGSSSYSHIQKSTRCF